MYEVPNTSIFNLNIIHDLEHDLKKKISQEKECSEEHIEPKDIENKYIETKKKVTFFNTVNAIIIPNKEALDKLSLWYSRNEYNRFRDKFNNEISKLIFLDIAVNRNDAFKKLSDPFFEEKNLVIKSVEKCANETHVSLVDSDY